MHVSSPPSSPTRPPTLPLPSSWQVQPHLRASAMALPSAQNSLSPDLHYFRPSSLCLPVSLPMMSPSPLYSILPHPALSILLTLSHFLFSISHLPAFSSTHFFKCLFTFHLLERKNEGVQIFHRLAHPCQMPILALLYKPEVRCPKPDPVFLHR